MLKIMTERLIPPGLDMSDEATLRRHCRIALDAHRRAGTCWLGTHMTEDRFFGIVAVEREANIRAFWRSAGIEDQTFKVHRIVRWLDPSLAADPSAERTATT